MGITERDVDDRQPATATNSLTQALLAAGGEEFRNYESDPLYTRIGVGRGAGSVTRTILLMVLLLIVGGGAAIYVWSSLNLLLKGEASLVQGVITILAIAGIIGLILLLQRLSLHYEDERDEES